jgi:hypothetical protein
VPGASESQEGHCKTPEHDENGSPLARKAEQRGADASCSSSSTTTTTTSGKDAQTQRVCGNVEAASADDRADERMKARMKALLQVSTSPGGAPVFFFYTGAASRNSQKSKS